MSNRFTKGAQNSLNKSLYFARELGHTYIGSEHLLMGIVSETQSAAAKLLSEHSVGFEAVKKAAEQIAGVGGVSSVTPNDMTPVPSE